MKKEMKRCAMFVGKALTMLTLIALSLCMASCGDDDDDSGGGESPQKNYPGTICSCSS